MLLVVGLTLVASDEKPGDITRFVFIISVSIINYAIYPTVQGGPIQENARCLNDF